MSSDTIALLKLITNQTTIYGGFFLLFTGMIGNILNIIVFTSLKTFRETSAAFYLNITSIVNILQLIVGLLSRIMITGFNIDSTQTSSFLCKGRAFAITATMLISFTCECFPVIDQYLSLTNRYRHFCNIKTASGLVLFSIIFWCLHGIPVLIFNGVYPTSIPNQTSCSNSNSILNTYLNRFVFPILLGLLPLFIRTVFGILAFINVRSLNNRQTPIVRLERDKQLTTMVLIEVVIDVIITLPYTCYNYLYTYSVTFSDPFSIAQNQLIGSIFRIVFYGNFSVPFYIYFCVSSRFRKQLKYVLVDIHFRYWHEKFNHQQENQVAPLSMIDGNGLSAVNRITL